ncbi:MAG: PhoPQ-activated protein PqaA family protein [Gemmataceae bacterium]
MHLFSSPARLAALLTLGLLAGSTQASVLDYVKKPDDAFKWTLKAKREIAGTRVYEIELTSQKWQSIVWKHDLVVLLPAKVEPTATMFLWNQGGKASTGSLLLANNLATRMQAPVAFLYGIPNQPLFDGLKEDALIAETFVRYLSTKDADWPLLFPMVKSLVRAMDALQAFAKDEWKKEVKSFVVAGASKRGWTTWLTGAADSRVKAIIPMVIDTLNFMKQMPYQVESYGTYSEQIVDYTRRKLAPPPKTPDAQKLWQMVDPWIYRDRITMPKLILNGANDPYWTQDALNLYWDDLVGDKWVCYVPNAGHNLQQKDENGNANMNRAVGAIASFARAYIHDKALPKVEWKHEKNGTKFLLNVKSDQVPKAVRLWSADASTRDFRKSTWKAQDIKDPGKAITAEVAPPETGCRVFFVECEYDLDGQRCYLSTQMRIVGTPEKK